MSELEVFLTQAARGAFDISSTDDHRRLRDLADGLLAADPSDDDLTAISIGIDRPIDLRLGATLARSKRQLGQVAWTGRIAVVFAMWGEQRRLRPRGDLNPTGEDALHVKLDQLDWLLDSNDIDWLIYPVDDGDPDDSAAVAEERALLHDRGDRVRVLRLADGVADTTGPLAGLGHVDESRKGGAIIHGAAAAMADGCDAVVMTDADNSVNLGQVGLLIAAHARGADVVIGDRKHPEAILIKAEARWGPGIVVLRHMQRMVGRALFERGLRDTQAAFKLYGRPALDDILAAPSTFGFAFDSDWLYGAVAGGHTIERVPFAFIDSFEESASITQGPMTTWESLLQGLVAAARSRGVDHDEEMASVIDDYGHAPVLEHVVQRVPPELEGIADDRLGDPDIMSPARLRSWLEREVGLLR